MRIYVVESKVRDVEGADWRAWDGQGFRNAALAEVEMAKLSKKKTAVVLYEWRVTPYVPESQGGCREG